MAAAPGDYAQLTDAEHTAWALQDAQADCDIAHVNFRDWAPGIPVCAFADRLHHGIDLSEYRFQPVKQRYLSFIGRIAPAHKSTHLAVEMAQRSGIP